MRPLQARLQEAALPPSADLSQGQGDIGHTGCPLETGGNPLVLFPRGSGRSRSRAEIILLLSFFPTCPVLFTSLPLFRKSSPIGHLNKNPAWTLLLEQTSIDSNGQSVNQALTLSVTKGGDQDNRATEHTW